MAIIKKLIFILLALFVLMGTALLVGFGVERIELKEAVLEKFEVEYDEGFRIYIDKLTLKETEKNYSTKEELTASVEDIFLFSPLLHSIQINNLVYKDLVVKLLLVENRLSIKKDNNKIVMTIGWNKPSVTIDIEKVALKDLNVSGSGKLSYNLSDGKYDGVLDFFNIQGRVEGELTKELFSFRVINGYSNDISSLGKVLPFDEDTRHWIYKRPASNEYHIKEFSIGVNLQSGELIEEMLKMDLYAFNVRTKFSDALPAGFTPFAKIKIENGFLSILGKDSIYRGKKLDVDVRLSLFEDKNRLTLNFITDAMLDRDVLDVIKHYGVDLGFTQTSGKIHSNATIVVGVDDGDDTVFVNVKSRMQKGALDIEGFVYSFENLYVLYQGEELLIGLDAKSPLGERVVMDLKGKLEDEKLTSTVFFKNYEILDGALLDIKNEKSTLDIDFKDGMDLYSKVIDERFRIKDGKFEVGIKSFANLIENSKILQHLGVKSGDFLFTGDKELVKGDINLETNSSIFSTGTQDDEKVHIELIKDSDTLEININDSIAIFDETNETKVLIDNVDINVTSFVSMYDKFFHKKEAVFEKKISLNGVGSQISYKDIKIKPDWYSLYDDKGKTIFQARKGRANISFEKEGESVTVRCKYIDSSVTNALFNIKMLGKDGYWSMIGYGDTDEKEFYGILKIKDMTLKEATAVMNVIAVINTVPALVQFKSPGFTSDGYNIKDGVIDFYYKEGKVYLRAIRLIGESTDIIGQGSADLDKKELDLTLSINTVKSLSKIIGSIPVVNYLLLDEDKTIGSVVKITGTFDEPQIDTNVGSDLVFYPFQILKRVLLLPSFLLNGDEEGTAE